MLEPWAWGKDGAAIVDAHKPGGVSSVVKAVPAPIEDAACVELTSVIKAAANPKHEGLEPWAGHGHNMVPQQHTKEGKCRPQAPS